MKVKKIPQRSCIGCGTKKDKKDLIRIVRTPDGDIVLDRTGKRRAAVPMSVMIPAASKKPLLQRAWNGLLTYLYPRNARMPC